MASDEGWFYLFAVNLWYIYRKYMAFGKCCSDGPIRLPFYNFLHPKLTLFYATT